MINVRQTNCLNCDTRASFNIKGMPSLYCAKHRTDDMINTRCKYCEECKLSRVHIKCGIHCLRCYLYLFPQKSFSVRYKIKENHIFEEILKNLPHDLNITRDKIVGGCSKRRPDLMIDLGSHWICAENDENCHRDYDTTCENKRIMELYTDLADRPMIIIRFNCDKYSGGDSLFKICKTSGIYVIRSKKKFKERITVFSELILKYITIVPDKAVTIEYLYYD